jgi:hypothetical protein
MNPERTTLYLRKLRAQGMLLDQLVEYAPGHTIEQVDLISTARARLEGTDWQRVRFVVGEDPLDYGVPKRRTLRPAGTRRTR